MSDDEDYMSNDFLEAMVEKDVRPGLIKRHAEKRKHEQIKQQERNNALHRQKNKSRAQIEEERREEGLKTEIGADNKGYQLLAKMGFKPGSSIGVNRSDTQTDNNSTQPGLREPISIVVKSNRRGLGEKSKLEEKRMKLEEYKQIRTQLSDPNQYRDRVREQVLMKEILIDLKRSQNVCKNLDLQNEKNVPLKSWYWPKVPTPEEEDEEEKDEEEEKNEEKLDEKIDEEEPEPEPQEQLSTLTKYLRQEYFYCLWCGANYDDATDLLTSCPGEKSDH